MYQQAIELINQWIITNGNNEITADVLRPILLAMVQASEDVTGDPSDLNTSANENLVAAINEINQALATINNGGVKLYTGTADPNDTPPVSFNNADFYMQVDGSNNPMILFQYNGFEWIPNGGNASNPDMIISMDEPTLTVDIYHIESGATWRINDMVFTNSADFDSVIAPASEGYQRFDIVVARANNLFNRITGVETLLDSPASVPTLPANTILVSTIYVTEDTFDFDNPIIGNVWVTKESYSANTVASTIPIDNLPRSQKATYVVKLCPEIRGIANASTAPTNDSNYSYQEYRIVNVSGSNVTLKHLHANGEIKFYFPNDSDYTLPNMACAKFTHYGGDSGRMIFIGAIGSGSGGSQNIDEVLATGSTAIGKTLLLRNVGDTRRAYLNESNLRFFNVATGATGEYSQSGFFIEEGANSETWGYPTPNGIDKIYADRAWVLANVISTGSNFANDAAAASGGIPVGGLYHTSGAVKIRLT